MPRVHRQTEKQWWAGFRRRYLQRLRELGLNYSTVADALDCDPGTASSWANPRRQFIPSGFWLARLATVLQCSAHWLITGKGPVAPPHGKDKAWGDGVAYASREMIEFAESLRAERGR